MFSRTISLDVKFPALMTALALGSSAAFLWLSQRELTRELEQNAGDRLRSSGAVIASLLASSATPSLSASSFLASQPEVREALSGPPSEPNATAIASAQAYLMRLPMDSSRIQLRLVDLTGETRLLSGEALPGGENAWPRDAVRAGRLATGGGSLGPFVAVGEYAATQIAYPVHAGRDEESLVGWLVETRRVRAQGVEAIKRLSESATLYVGSLEGGVWTDFERVVAGPPAGTRPDSLVRFVDEALDDRLGVATLVRGTPWVVWLERDRASVLAPLSDFRRRVAPVALLLALITLVVGWRLSRGITNRVVRLTERVDRMAADPRLTDDQTGSRLTDGKDEIARLEISFDAMHERTVRQMERETQLLDAQKLEAVGRLAGGVAHDFNNVLTVITNYTEMLRADAPHGSQTAADLDQVLRAAERAAHLTRQLLAFSRRQVVQPRMIDVNAVVTDVHSMLRRLIPTHIEFDLELGDGIGPIFADPAQVEQVIVNLALNASDAMPSGGRLAFRTFEGELDADDPSPRATSRRFACIAVRDTGHGMDRATLRRIFEPFFTTKPQGKGTGLGLAMVHGIVTQLGGRVWAYSEPNIGTTFKIFLPVHIDATVTEDVPLSRRDTPPKGVGSILVVEDDEAARGVTARVLQQAGFDVRLAPDGNTALAALESGPLPRVVVSDLMMPGLDGAQLSQRIREQWPQLPVVIVSGYADVVLHTGELHAAVILEKPFTAHALVDAIARATQAVEPNPSIDD